MKKIKNPPINDFEVRPEDVEWETLSMYFSRQISLDVREALRRDSDLQRFALGQNWVLGSLLDRIEKMENAVVAIKGKSRSVPHDYLPDAEGGRFHTEPLERHSFEPHASYLGVLSGLIARLAMAEQDELLAIVRPVLARYSPEYQRVRKPANLESALASRGKYGCTSGSSLYEALKMISELENGDQIEDPLARACEQLKQWTLRVSRDASEPLNVRQAQRNASRHLPIAVEVGTNRFRPDYEQKSIRILKEEGFLAFLRLAAEMLCAKYQWALQGALHFLGVGFGHPILKLATVEIDARTGPTCLSRITLTVDPTLSPNEVKDLYASARKQLLPHNKELSLKSLLLVSEVFNQSYMQIHDSPNSNWYPLMLRWNSEIAPHIKGQRTDSAFFADTAQFRRDALQARDRLLNPKTQSPTESIYYPRIAFDRDRKTPKGETS